MKMTLQDHDEMLVMEAERPEDLVLLAKLTFGSVVRPGPLAGAVPILGEPEPLPAATDDAVWYAHGCAPGYGRPMVGLTWSLKPPMRNHGGAQQQAVVFLGPPMPLSAADDELLRQQGYVVVRPTGSGSAPPV